MKDKRYNSDATSLLKDIRLYIAILFVVLTIVLVFIVLWIFGIPGGKQESPETQPSVSETTETFPSKEPDVPSTTSENVEIIHNIIEAYAGKLPKESGYSSEYCGETLYNFGLYSRWHKEWGKKDTGTGSEWNGTWVLTDDFVKQYVEKYSLAEFLEVFDDYAIDFLFQSDFEFCRRNEELLAHITETTHALLELCEVWEYCPAKDEVLRTTTETKNIEGEFIVGEGPYRVGHVWTQTRSSEYVVDTYFYGYYKVEHHYGDIYDPGDYNTKIYDINGEEISLDGLEIKTLPSFVHVDEYYLNIRDHIIGPVKTLDELDFRAFIYNSDLYVEWVINGFIDRNGFAREFYEPVTVVTKDLEKVLVPYIEE